MFFWFLERVIIFFFYHGNPITEAKLTIHILGKQQGKLISHISNNNQDGSWKKIYTPLFRSSLYSILDKSVSSIGSKIDHLRHTIP